MPYRYLDDIATADVAFEAWGASEEELYISAADAVLNVMVENITTVTGKEHRTIRCKAESREMLLFHLLEELIYYKDAERLFLRVATTEIGTHDNLFTLMAQTFGDTIDPERHELNVDVKAVTFHRFSYEHTERGWTAVVVLDI